MKVGIIKEGKQPIDRRVPLTPVQVAEAVSKFGVEIIVQSSNVRCYSDEEYTHAGVKVVNDVNDCDIIVGVKEVPIDQLIPKKTFLFFSHTVKMQAYNRRLLQEIVQREITLIDYELITGSSGNRLVAFGRYAGIIGAYNALWTFGKRYNLFHLERAYECFDLNELLNELPKVTLPPIKIVLTGGGRVAKGAMEILNAAKIRRVSPGAFLEEQFNQPVYAQLNSRDYHKHRKGKEFNRAEFYANPEEYESDFLKYAHTADLLIAGAFWSPGAPVLFERSDILSPKFQIKVVADITCDIEGSIPSTLAPSTIEEPIYDYNPSEHKIESPLSEEANITVMAVDNLPCELPRDSSEAFGRQLIDAVFPELFSKKGSEIIKNATIVEGDMINSKFEYLNNWIQQG